MAKTHRRLGTAWRWALAVLMTALAQAALPASGEEPPPARVLEIRMSGADTLRIRYQVDQGIKLPSLLYLEVAINSARIFRQFDAPTPLSPIGGLSQPRVEDIDINLQAEGVPRFAENVIPNARLSGTRADGTGFVHVFQGRKILLPVVGVHGITSDLALMFGLEDGGIFGLVDGDPMWELGRRAEERWGYRREGLEAIYPTWFDHVTSTPKRQRDQIPDLDATVHRALIATYADRVNLVGHSMGGLIGRGLMQQQPSLVRWLVAVASPNEGSAKVYRPYGCQTEVCVAVAAQFGAVQDLYPLWPAVWEQDLFTGEHPWPFEHHSEYLQEINANSIPGARFSAVCGEEEVTLYTVYRTVLPPLPTSFITRSEVQGDGTVPLSSCFIVGHELVRVTSGGYNHGTVPLARETLDLIEQRLVRPVRVELTVQAASSVTGRPLPNGAIPIESASPCDNGGDINYGCGLRTNFTVADVPSIPNVDGYVTYRVPGFAAFNGRTMRFIRWVCTQGYCGAIDQTNKTIQVRADEDSALSVVTAVYQILTGGQFE